MDSTENTLETPQVVKKPAKTILDNFSQLTNQHENVRIKCAVNLLKYLVENHNEEVRGYGNF